MSTLVLLVVRLKLTSLGLSKMIIFESRRSGLGLSVTSTSEECNSLRCQICGRKLCDQVHQELAKQKARALVVAILDEVAWLFNLCKANLDLLSCLLWLCGSYHRQCDPVCQPEAGQAGQKRLIGDKMGVGVAKTIELSYIRVTCSPIMDLRAIKNVSEIEGFCVSHMRVLGACAMLWVLEEQLNQDVKLFESQGADQLEKFNSQASTTPAAVKTLTLGCHIQWPSFI